MGRDSGTMPVNPVELDRLFELLIWHQRCNVRCLGERGIHYEVIWLGGEGVATETATGIRRSIALALGQRYGCQYLDHEEAPEARMPEHDIAKVSPVELIHGETISVGTMGPEQDPPPGVIEGAHPFLVRFKSTWHLAETRAYLTRQMPDVGTTLGWSPEVERQGR